MIYKKYLAILFAFAVCLGVQAQDKITTTSNMIGVGPTNVLDTYLTPEKYSGMELRVYSESAWQKSGRRWSSLMINQGDVSYSKNRADNAKEITGMYNLMYGRIRDFSAEDSRLRIKAGIVGDMNIGVIYNTHQGNNPAQARCYLNVAPVASAEYDFSLWNKMFTLRYTAGLPLLGLMFSPNYGQSYYEIFSLGNYDHNIVPTTVFSAPSYRHSLTLDIPVGGKTKLRVGYLGDYQQSEVNNLKSHIYSHLFMIGYVKRFTIVNL